MEDNCYTQLKSLKDKDLHASITKILNCVVPSDFKVVEEIFFKNIYRSENIKPGSVWIDLGANIGAFSLCVLMHGGTPIAYEPSIRNFKKLETLPIQCYHQAVSDYHGTAKLYLDRNNEWRHTLKPIRGRATEEVMVIDALELPPCDGMKIDIEGSELSVIYRMKHFPQYLVIEYDGGHHPLKKDYDQLINYLKTIYQTVQFKPLKKDIAFFPNGLLIRCSHI